MFYSAPPNTLTVFETLEAVYIDTYKKNEKFRKWQSRHLDKERFLERNMLL